MEKELEMILAEMFELHDRDTSWHTDAACRDTNTAKFFIEPRTKHQHEQIFQAKQICNSCPVKKRCLEYALNNHIRDGIWGGYTTRQRRGIARDRRNRI